MVKARKNKSRKPQAKPRPDALAYPIKDAFEVIGVGHDRGYRLIAEGLLRSYKHGKRRFASREACNDCVIALERAAR